MTIFNFCNGAAFILKMRTSTIWSTPSPKWANFYFHFAKRLALQKATSLAISSTNANDKCALFFGTQVE